MKKFFVVISFIFLSACSSNQKNYEVISYSQLEEDYRANKIEKVEVQDAYIYAFYKNDNKKVQVIYSSNIDPRKLEQYIENNLQSIDNEKELKNPFHFTFDPQTLQKVDEFGDGEYHALILKDENKISLLQENHEQNNIREYSKDIYPYIDIETFEKLENGKGLYKDKNKIYNYSSLNHEPIFYELLPLEKIDINKYEILGNGYIRDDDAVYLGGRFVTDDVGNFKIIGDIYAKDNEKFYVYGKNVEEVDAPIENFEYDEVTFAYGEDSMGTYFRNKGKVYQVGYLGFSEIIDPDKKERILKIINKGREGLGYGYLRDEKHVYYMDKDEEKILHAVSQPETFKVYSYGYARDLNDIYKDGEIFETFPKGEYDFLKGGFFKNTEYVFRHHYARFDDGNINIPKTNLGMSIDIMTGVWDVASFEAFNELYARDKYFAYICEENCEVIPGADPQTIEILIGKSTGDHPMCCENPFEIDFRHNGNMYTKDANHVFKYEKIIPEADAETFVALNYGFAKDKNNAFYYGEIIKGADVRSFGVLEEGPDYRKFYAKDKDKIFLGARKINEVDPYTFQILEEGFSKDKNNVYSGVLKIQNADPDSFKNIFLDYAKDKNAVYYGDTKWENSDPNTFELIDYGKYVHYAKDKNNVYYSRYIIHNANPATFEIINWPYSKDSKNIFWKEIEIKNIDLRSFERIDFNYSKDKNHVYHCDDIYIDSERIKKCEVLSSVDPTTFKVPENESDILTEEEGKVVEEKIDLGGGYYRKIDEIFYNSHIVEASDTESFISLAYDYAKDKNFVYYGVEKIDKINAQKFEIINPQFIKDDKNLYFYRDNTIANESIDPNSFEILSPLFSKDQNGIYVYFYQVEGCEVDCKKMILLEKVDYKSFEVVVNPYAKDKNVVYYVNKILIDSDPNSFEFLGEITNSLGYTIFYAKDKNHVYKDSEILEDSDPATFKVPEN